MNNGMLNAIGLMSGTSLDGVDAAWLQTDGISINHLGPSVTLRYTDLLRAELRHLLDRAPTIAADNSLLLDIEHRLTFDHALATSMLGMGADVIGLHGQTILHAPAAQKTWQIGDAKLLARMTRTRVVHNFRAADVAAGGQGAPLAPLFHAAMAQSLPKPLLIVNIGGVANLTYLGAGGEIMACDTGPGNGPLDDLVFRHTGAAYDQDGALAAAGLFRQDRLQMLMDDPYFALPPPKSLDRLHFSGLIEQAIAGLSLADAAATLTAFTVAAIAATKFSAPPLRILVCGGGRKNKNIMDRLNRAFGAPVMPVESAGWDGDALEAQCFAFLAVRSLYGLPLSLPTTTGVPAPMLGGELTAPIGRQ